MTKKPIPTFKPTTNLLRMGSVTLTAAVALLAAGPALADTMTWTGTSYIVSQDRATGQFQRRGVAMFASGEVATFTLAGQVTSFDPKVLTYNVKMVYTFEDGPICLPGPWPTAMRSGAAQPTPERWTDVHTSVILRQDRSGRWIRVGQRQPGQVPQAWRDPG